MRVQYIGLDGLVPSPKGKRIKVTRSSLNSPRDLDDFDFNFIDLNHVEIWNRIPKTSRIPGQYLSDFKTLKMMIDNTTSKILISIPQSSIGDQESLKDYLHIFQAYFSEISPINVKIIYGKTTTKMNELKARADFSFLKADFDTKVWTSSENSNKATTISFNNLYLTTLDIIDYECLEDLLIAMNMLSKEVEITPIWMNKVKLFDDEEQLEKIRAREQHIEEIKKEIIDSQNKLNENQRLKSILYTQSDELVEVVFSIIEELLTVDLTMFEDKKIEDISFELDGKVFIGEIKGINSNVKTSNLSQLDNHFTSFLESHAELREEDVYKLLIINHQRNKPLDKRDPVDIKQIEAARNKYGSLIIETYELLKILEKYREKELDRDALVEMFCQKGILKP